MAVAKVECPECGKVLKPAKPLTPGKKVRCPKCGAVFTVPGTAEEETPAVQEAIRKAAPASKKAGPAKPKAAPAPEPKKPALDEDDDGAAYGMLKEPGEEEEDEEDKKPKINDVPDLEVKNPRGPATLALAMPSNLLMLWGALMCVGCLVSMAVATWPFMFTEHGTAVTPLEARKEYAKRNPPKRKPGEKEKVKRDDKEEAEPDVKYDELTTKPNGGELAVFDDLKEDDVIFRIWWAVLSVVLLIYAGIMAFSSVQMQNLEDLTAGRWPAPSWAW